MRNKKEMKLLPIKTFYDLKFVYQSTSNTLSSEYVLDISFRIVDWLSSNGKMDDLYVLNLLENFRIYANEKLEDEVIETLNKNLNK